jgi:hypothetical protein
MQRIREYYGVPAKRGMRIVYHGAKRVRLGTITGSDTAGMYLRIRLDGDRRSTLFHPTWQLEYLTENEMTTIYDCMVTLHIEQEATVILYGLENNDLSDVELREMALSQLDESGGAEWKTLLAYEDHEWFSVRSEETDDRSNQEEKT